MNDIRLHGLLEALAKLAKPYAKNIQDDLQHILVAVELAKERKATGGLTRKAHQKVQQLRNPYFDTAHAPGAEQALNRLLRTTHKKMVNAITEAVKLTGVHQQALLERSLHDDKPSIIAPSREGPPVEGWEDLGRFTKAMEDREVELFRLGRLRNHEFDFMADLIMGATNDPQYANPENRWNHLFHGGFLDAYRNNLTDDEAILLADVKTFIEDPTSLVLRDKLEARLGRTLDVTPQFAAACQVLATQVGELSFGEADALFHAERQQWSRETPHLCQLLSIPVEDKIKVEAIVRLLSSRTLTSDDFGLRFAFHAIKTANEALERNTVPYHNWLPALADVFGGEESFVGKQFRDPAGFWALYAHVLKNSETFHRLTAEREQAHEQQRQARSAAARAELDKLGIPYDLDEWGTAVPRDGKDRFDDAVFEELDEPDEGLSGASLAADDRQQPGQWLEVISPPRPPPPEHLLSDLFGDLVRPRAGNAKPSSKYEDYE